MDDTPAPDLRPLATRLIDRLLHVPREPPACAHCEHVTELRTRLRIAQWLIGLALSALFLTTARDFVSYMSQRVRWVEPGRSGERLPGADGRK